MDRLLVRPGWREPGHERPILFELALAARTRLEMAAHLIDGARVMATGLADGKIDENGTVVLKLRTASGGHGQPP